MCKLSPCRMLVIFSFSPSRPDGTSFSLDIRWDPSCRKRREKGKEKKKSEAGSRIGKEPHTPDKEPQEELVVPENEPEQFPPQSDEAEKAPGDHTEYEEDYNAHEFPHQGEHDQRRRTRPRPSPSHKMSESRSVPNTLREVLEGVTVQHVAMENWSRKRLVLVGSGQTLERVKHYASLLTRRHFRGSTLTTSSLFLWSMTTRKKLLAWLVLFPCPFPYHSGIEDVIAVMHDMMYAGPVKARVELMTKPISEVLHRGYPMSFLSNTCREPTPDVPYLHSSKPLPSNTGLLYLQSPSHNDSR